MRFTDLVSPGLAESLEKCGYVQATAVQTKVLPLRGDVCIWAATGSGKTLAYALPMVEDLKHLATKRLRALVVVPTRELVNQARKTLEMCSAGMGIAIGTAVGDKPIAARIESDILICTPGRLVDHVTRGLSLDDVEWLVVDEVDRLMDESFQQWVDIVIPLLETSPPNQMERDIYKTFRIPKERRMRKIVLSATATGVRRLRLKAPTIVTTQDAPALQEQAIAVDTKPLHLMKLLDKKALVFTKDNESALRLTRLIELLHPDTKIGCLTKLAKSKATINNFLKGDITVLIASDRASRGLDIPDLDLVVNYDMPNSLTTYVHRVGRTARAGRDGQAITLVEHHEAKWFWDVIGKERNVQRVHQAVEKDESYQKALDVLKGAVLKI